MHATHVLNHRAALRHGAPPPHEDSLGRYLNQCLRVRGRWFGAAQWAERVHGWCAPRLVTTVALASAALSLTLSWL